MYRVFGVISGNSVPSISAMQPSLQSCPSIDLYLSVLPSEKLSPLPCFMLSLNSRILSLLLSSGIVQLIRKRRDSTADTSTAVGLFGYSVVIEFTTRMPLHSDAPRLLIARERKM